MATRGYENFTQADVTRRALKQQAAPKPSKYRNVKTVVGDETFDSKREAEHWMVLQAREQLGEIRHLQRQIPFHLLCPVRWMPAPVNQIPRVVDAVVSYYVADFVYEARVNGEWQRVVVDAKGGNATKTAVYKLKKKHLELQEHIVIQEV